MTAPLWLQIIQAAGGIATTIGVLIALYIAFIRDPREASAEHKHHVAQMNALRNARAERFGAQARKLVPSCIRTPMLGEAWWAVRIDNASNEITTIIGVDVAAVDSNGVDVPDGCARVDHAFDKSIRAALSQTLDTALDRHLNAAIMQAIQDAVAVHFVNGWPRTIAPNHHAVMCYTTADPRHELRVTIDYEDEAGFQWRRTDTTQPQRTDAARR